MNRKHLIVFIAFFLAVIYSIPITQGCVEYVRYHKVQALDLVVDAVFTPFSKANVINGLLVKTQKQVEALNAEINKSHSVPPDKKWESYTAEQLADDALFIVSDIKKSASTINRHVRADTTTELFVKLNGLSQGFSDVLAALRNGEQPDSIISSVHAIGAQVADLIEKYPKKTAVSAPLLATKNIPHIFWNDLYLRPYEKEMENTSVFATAIRPAMLYTRFLFFNDLGEKAVPGQGGWFFYKPDVDYLVRPYIRDPRSIIVDPNDKPVTDDPIKAIVAFKDQLAKNGTDLLVMIIPVKASIYPDVLNSSVPPTTSGKISQSLRIIDELNKNGVETVDLFSAFAEERKNDASCGDSLYLAKDTHWRARGARTAARVVAERIKKYPWYTPGNTTYQLDSLTIDRNGDVGVMTTLPSIKIHDLTMSFPTEKTRCYQVFTLAKDDATGETQRVLYKDDYKNAQILILGDSFSRIYQTDEPRSAGWIAHCAYELSQPVASIVNDGGASTLVRQSLARKASLLKGKKLVVWEVVERDFRFGEEGWKDVPLKLAEK
jgi:hypothetical protein